MEHMEYIRVILIAGLFLGAYVLYLIFGKNKREEKKVPVGMELLTMSPFLRYIMYAVGVLAILGGGLMALMLIDMKEEWPVIILVFVLFGIIAGMFFLMGYIFYARHIFFNREKIMIGRLFHGPDILEWNEVSRVDLKKTRLVLYDVRGKRRLEASAGMTGYEAFRVIAEERGNYLGQRPCR